MIASASQARSGFVPLFVADWFDALFIHFRVEPPMLRSRVPLELDLFDGAAYISLVGFTQRRLRPRVGGRWTELLSRPLAEHGFLNLRTYVRHEGVPGIYFLSEWIPNRLAVLIGPAMYGLPYRIGRLDYRTGPGQAIRRVDAPAGRFACRASWDASGAHEVCPAASEAEFLLERYFAFTWHQGILRRFQIAHEPWRQVPALVSVQRSDLLGLSLPPPIGGNFSHGVMDVAIGRPLRCRRFNASASERYECVG